MVLTAFFLPLISSIICGLFCKKVSDRFAAVVSSFSIVLSAVLFSAIFIDMISSHSDSVITIGNWCSLGDIDVSFAVRIDSLSAIMFTVVSIVSALVHIYSVGYMSEDENLPRFMSYLSLFTFFMFLLVASNNFMQFLFGWEGVGLCSYLLIGFWYKKDSASAAAIKAFIVNRISDSAFILGIICIIYYCGSVDFTDVFVAAKSLPVETLNLITMLLFIGAMGKSAQIGLHIWLPDAMEGPTPVSALIHSATMVTAGVFMVVRCSFLFELSPLVLNFMTIIGSVTSLFAASSALGQTDIKRVIAYSTSSQLGYMFVACGVSAYNAALFHLVTHAIFKSMIFLSAGSVIYACHEQDLEKLGGLWKKMPVTYASFWIGSLAIIGIFPFAGYYSKDMILDFVAARPREWIYYIAVITVFLTACYSMKLIMMIFHGQSKVGKVIFAKVCDARSLMTAPLLILAVLSISSGVFGYYYLRIYAVDGYLGKAIANFYDESTISFYADHTTLLVGSLGVVCAIFVLRNFIVTGNSNWAGRAIAKGYYFDEIYRLTIVRATFLLSKGLKFCDYNVIDRFGPKAFVDGIFFLGKVLKFFDYNVIDRLGPRAFTAITNSMTKIISRMQSGYLFDYALFMMLGLIIAVSMVLFIYIEKIL